jgi:hypothetical protein
MLRPALPFLFAVLISASIWAINSLNKTHSTSVEFLVEYQQSTTAPEKGYTKSITAEISGNGFDLIRFLTTKKSCVLRIADTQQGRIHSMEVVTKQLRAVDKNLKVTRVTPVWIDPPQKQLYSRKLKVVADSDFRTAGSYVKTIPAICVPDCLMVYSELPFPENLQTIRTDRIEKKQLQSSWFGSVSVVNPAPGSYITETDKIWIYQPVEEATEISISLPVNPGAGIPYNFRFIPASVTLTCVVPVSRYSITTADKFMVAASVNSADQKRAIINVLQAPAWADNIRYSPSAVEFLKITP